MPRGYERISGRAPLGPLDCVIEATDPVPLWWALRHTDADLRDAIDRTFPGESLWSLCRKSRLCSSHLP